MKITLAAILLCLGISSFFPHEIKNISELKWKNRIIIFQGNLEDLAQIKSLNAEITERHIIWFAHINEQYHSNYSKSISEVVYKSIFNHYISDQNKSLLIGKDGLVKSRNPKLILQKYFRQIDSMPMRQAEMRKLNHK